MRCRLPDISESLDKKIKALEAHASQVMKTNIEDLSITQIARSSANFRGIQGRVKYAEGFTPLRLFINI
jgi:LmbE family N-acetylglucosaminyl deacetylase